MNRIAKILALAVFCWPLAVSAEPDSVMSSSDEDSVVAQSAKATDSSKETPPSVNNSDSTAEYLERWEDHYQEQAWEQAKEDNKQDTKEAVAEDIILN